MINLIPTTNPKTYKELAKEIRELQYDVESQKFMVMQIMDDVRKLYKILYREGFKTD